MPLKIVTCRGIGEPMDHNMLSRVVANFPNTKHVELPWEADYGPVGLSGWKGEPYLRTTYAGSQMLLEEILKDDGFDSVVLGYSGGTDVILNALGSYTVFEQVKYVGMVAAPSAPGLERSGIRTHIASVHNQAQDLIWRYPVKWVSHPRDVICSAPSDSPLRDFASASEGFGLGDLDFWGRDILTKLATQKLGQFVLHPFSIPSIQRKYAQAYEDACGYLGVSKEAPWLPGPNYHTGYWFYQAMSGRTYLDDLALDLARAKKEYDEEETATYSIGLDIEQKGAVQ